MSAAIWAAGIDDNRDHLVAWNLKPDIVDYQDTSALCGPARDEIRQIGDHLYLGRAYIRTPMGPIFAVNFALDFADAE